jgi:DNA adenine methylase
MPKIGETTQKKIKTGTVVPWFGGTRTLAPEVGRLLDGCRWVGIPFGGGMPEVAYIRAPTVVVSDLHRHVINLARVLATEDRAFHLASYLTKLPFHPDVLSKAQKYCLMVERGEIVPNESQLRSLERWAANYFISSWMGHSGKSGTHQEFSGNLSTRWNANGGDSNVRFRSAVASIQEWHKVLTRCSFTVQDCFDFLEKVNDTNRTGLYCDPPFPDLGVKYKHSFTEEQHRRLAEVLSSFSRVKVVCRFYGHPLVAELYPTVKWEWHFYEGRKQSNAKGAEVLLTNWKT